MRTLPPGYIHPNNYTVIEMVTFLAMVVFGGLGHIWGGIIGAIIVTIVYDLTRPLYEYQLFIFGLTIVLTILFMPKGIGGFIDKIFIDKRFKKKKFFGFQVQVKRTEIAIVYIHGYSASPQEVRPVPEKIANKLNANLYFSRLTGHGCDSKEMSKAQIQDWLNDTAEAIAIGHQNWRKYCCS